MAETGIPAPYGNDYEWPENLFDEMYEMGTIAFLTYTFGYLVDAARKAKAGGKTFTGLDTDEEGAKIFKSSSDQVRHLQRSFTPAEIKKIVEDNAEVLADYGVSSDFRGEKLVSLYETLDALTARGEGSTDERPLTIEEFDDQFQKREVVYGICVDRLKKRITVSFRGTDELAFLNNWKTNASIAKQTKDVPEIMKGKTSSDTVKLHTGFTNYLFSKTKDETDAEETTKYDQILVDLKAVLATNPGFKIYVTGHSLGAAMSTLGAFFLSGEPDLPKPVSCINFASPRVGDSDFLHATQYLEKTKQLRILRSVNENDSVTAVPSVGYRHIGFSVTCYKKGWFGRIPEPEIEYKNVHDGAFAKFTRRMRSSLVSSLNLRYDHSDYLERILLVKEDLEKTSLNKLYLNEKMLGYKLDD